MPQETGQHNTNIRKEKSLESVDGGISRLAPKVPQNNKKQSKRTNQIKLSNIRYVERFNSLINEVLKVRAQFPQQQLHALVATSAIKR
eukprot:291624-Amphidinium_carterae.1